MSSYATGDIASTPVPGGQRGAGVERPQSSRAAFGPRLVLVFVTVLLLALAPGLLPGLAPAFVQPAAAQSPALQQVFGFSSSEEEDGAEQSSSAQTVSTQFLPRLSSPSSSSSPAQSTPVPSSSRPALGTSSGPSIEDYGRLSGEPADDSMTMSIGRAGDWLTVFRARLAAIVKRVPSALDELSVTLRASSPTGKPVHFLGLALFAGLLVIVGRAVAELYLVFVARPVFVRMQQEAPRGYVEKLPVLVMRVILGVLAVTITLAVASGVGLFFYDDHKETLITAVAVFGSYGAIMIVHTFWRMALAPFLPEYRIPNIDARGARRLYRWATGASVLAILGSAFAFWVEGLGLPTEIIVIVTTTVTFATLLVLIAAIRVNYTGVTGILIGDRQGRPMTWIQRVVAAAWAPFAILYLIVSWGDVVFRLVMGVGAGPERLMLPFLVLLAGGAIYATTIYLVERIFDRQRRIAAINAAVEARAAEAAVEEEERAAIRESAWRLDGSDEDG
ncbi:MAG: hypothetical protein AAF675_16205, partial [Pseudomonadota bacterium]